MPPQRILIHSLCISTSCCVCVCVFMQLLYTCTLYFVNILLHVTRVLLRVTGVLYIDLHVYMCLKYISTDNWFSVERYYVCVWCV